MQYTFRVSWQILNDVAYIIDEACNELFILDCVGKAIWLLIGKNMNREMIIQTLHEKYDVSKSLISSDVDEFLEQLTSRQLIIGGY